MAEKLHTHPQLERKLGLDSEHVIVDHDTFDRLFGLEHKDKASLRMIGASVLNRIGCPYCNGNLNTRKPTLEINANGTHEIVCEDCDAIWVDQNDIEEVTHL